MVTAYHAKYFAFELTKRCSSDTVEKFASSLVNAQVDLNPHQIDAALFAFRSPLSKGALLADEVGLGKTIEAGLIISQKWAERKRKLLIIAPANLRKQWMQELQDKFFLASKILESKSFNEELKRQNLNPFVQSSVIITSYQFARSKEAYLKLIPWDLVIIDEAHRLRNVYKSSNKIALAIKDALGEVPKVLLTATPLQNSLLELYGLISIIDERVFGDIKSFKAQFSVIRGAEDFQRLQERIKPVCQRTLRRQVLEYIRYTNRIPLTQDFIPSPDEQLLYDKVSAYLQRPVLFALPASQRQLMTLILRKLLASSTFAVSSTLARLVERLEDIELQNSKQLNSDIFADVENFQEIQEEWIEATDLEAEHAACLTPEQIILLKEELSLLREFLLLARKISKNAKGEVLITAIENGFQHLRKLMAPQKAIIFTESTRTQEYIRNILADSPYSGKIVLFNGSNGDVESKAIYKEWLLRNKDTDKVTGSPTADMRAALVEYFRDEASIMIATEAAAEGINLQFCSLVINYDLPWNPQRIEQRIGRCHRYGQKFDVVVVNFLNRRNAADQRVFQLLDQKFQLFSGVFGASDEVLGAVESGVDFEKRIVAIYQSCRSEAEIDEAFDRLQIEMEGSIQENLYDTRRKLLENFDAEVHDKLRVNLQESQRVLDRYEKLLWESSKYFLRGNANFSETEYSFTLTRNPFPELTIEAGPYRIGKNINDAHIYRPGHPLAQALLERLKSNELEPALLKFDYSSSKVKVSVLEQMVGQAGYLRVTRLGITSLESEDRIIVACIRNDGSVVETTIAEKLFNLDALYGGIIAIPGMVEEQLHETTESNNNFLLSENLRRNSTFFDTEVDKLEKWSEDIKLALELDLKNIDIEIKTEKTNAKKVVDLETKVKAQKAIKDLERKRNEMRRTLFEAQDEVEGKKEKLLSEIESRLKSESEKEILFTISWEVI